MDLNYTASAAGIPAARCATGCAPMCRPNPLPATTRARASSSTARWEATLADGGWSSVTWPDELGGRGCDLIDWLIFEEEYCRRRRADARQPERHLAARPDA